VGSLQATYGQLDLILEPCSLILFQECCQFDVRGSMFGQHLRIEPQIQIWDSNSKNEIPFSFLVLPVPDLKKEKRQDKTRRQEDSSRLQDLSMSPNDAKAASTGSIHSQDL